MRFPRPRGTLPQRPVPHAPTAGQRPPWAGRALAGGFGPRRAKDQRGAVAGAMAPARIRKARAGGSVSRFPVRQPLRQAPLQDPVKPLAATPSCVDNSIKNNCFFFGSPAGSPRNGGALWNDLRGMPPIDLSLFSELGLGACWAGRRSGVPCFRKDLLGNRSSHRGGGPWADLGRRILRNELRGALPLTRGPDSFFPSGNPCLSGERDRFLSVTCWRQPADPCGRLIACLRRASQPCAGARVKFLSSCFYFGNLVGARGFEPPTPCSRSRCATRLRYAPTLEGGLNRTPGQCKGARAAIRPDRAAPCRTACRRGAAHRFRGAGATG